MAERDPNLAGQHSHPGYGEDYARWLDGQLDALRDRRFDQLDIDHLVEEVGDLGVSNFKAFIGAIRVVLLHMLKWDHQPSGRTNRSWWLSIDEHRDRIARDLADSPSYRAKIEDAVARAYPSARRSASADTGLPLSTFPEACPYDWDAIVGRPHEHGD
jgi:hypothetical protein